MTKVKPGILNGGRGSGQTVRHITAFYEEKIADLKANFDYVLEGKDLEIKELKEDLRNKKIAIQNRKAERNKLCDDFENMKAGLESQIATLGGRCNQLLKDKGDLTDRCDKLLDVINNQDVKIADLEQQIEKMKSRKVFLLQIVDADDYTVDSQFYTTDEDIAKEWDKYDKHNYCFGQAIELEELSDKERMREELGK